MYLDYLNYYNYQLQQQQIQHCAGFMYSLYTNDRICVVIAPRVRVDAVSGHLVCRQCCCVVTAGQ